MNASYTFALGLAILGLTTLGLTACTTVQTEIVIRASPATIWKVIADGPGYAEWNPVQVRVDGEYREGAKVKIHLREPSGKTSSFDSKVQRVVEERVLNQGGGAPLLFTFDHTFSLEPVEGGTRLTQREEFRGIGTLFVDMRWVEPAYQRVNAALKSRAEAAEAQRAR